MRILFLNPSYGRGFCKTARWFAKSRAREQRHPDYLCTAIALLERSGHVCKLVDGAARGISAGETTSIIREFNPEGVVINMTTPSLESDLGYARLSKENSSGRLVTIAIGPHVSAQPEDTLIRGGGSLDAVFRREYDYTLREFADTGEIKGLKGASFREKERVVHNDDRPFISNPEELPFPAWKHIDINDYYAPAKRNPFLTLISGRGCEGRCVFCLFPQVMYGRSYRPRSVDNVLDEIEYDLGLFPELKEIMFEDDTFTLLKYRERLEAICRGMSERNIKISWSCNARPELTDLSLLRLMKRSGCRMMCVGFESGDQEILNRLKKGTSPDKMMEFAISARKAGISVHGCFVFGAPGETTESIRKTVSFAKRLPIDTAQFSGLCAYPGTEFFEWVKEKGYLVPGDWKDWVDEKGEQKAIVQYPGLSCGRINKEIDKALYGFYLRPGYILSQIARPKSLEDIQARFRGVKNFLDHLFSKTQ